MLKAGIFVDVDNLVHNGGYGMRFEAVRELARAQGTVVVRANAYMAVDRDTEQADPEYRRKKAGYREAVRRAGYRVGLTEVRRYPDGEGGTVMKADADMDMAIDCLLQSENLDYVMLGTGDGDFLRLVRALQMKGRRVDLLSFHNTSGALRREVDFHFDGFLWPGILPEDPDRADLRRGVVHAVQEDKGYGFVTVRTGYEPHELRDDVFLHINDFTGRRGEPVTNEEFSRLRERNAVIEFDLEAQEEGRVRAANAREVVPEE